MSERRIAVFGAGYVGLVTAACLAELGHTVAVRDVIASKVEALRAGEVPIHEPGLEELLARNRDRLSFTLDVRDALEGAEFVFICVDTPPTYSGDADLSRVWTVIDELAATGASGILVMKSTVPVGTGEKVRAALDARGLGEIGYVSNPEFTAEGTAVRDFLHPDRIIIGAFEEAHGDAAEALHAGIDAPVVRTDVASAEMVKLASNAALMTRISFINEIANVCEAVGADVEEVARGVGLDRRLGPHFLRAGIGYGGSCLPGDETVLVRLAGRTQLLTFAKLFEVIAPEAADDDLVLEPVNLEVLAWRADADRPEFLPVSVATRRVHEGELVEVRTKMGRQLRCTPDHPLIVSDGDGENLRVEQADCITASDWLPMAQGTPAERRRARRRAPVLAGMTAAGLTPGDVIVRPYREHIDELGHAGIYAGTRRLDHPRGRQRAYDIVRSGAMRLDELELLRIPRDGATAQTALNGTRIPAFITIDEAFWRVVGLYIAEGHWTRDGQRERLQWSFHPRKEFDLVEELLRYWRGHGVKADLRIGGTTAAVVLSSRLLAGWWLGVLGLGRNCYEHRIPDLVWDQPLKHKRALLSGMWRGDGSWSLVAGGPSAVLQYGTVSRELADGTLRLLGELGVAARLRIGRSAKSTCDTFWLTISGAEQVEKMSFLLSEHSRDRLIESLSCQSRRIAPTGYRRHHPHAAWVRVLETRRERFRGPVYSLEVPDAHSFVTTGGLVVHNCFPKDSLALKQLAANSGYHFQLLSAVIEVNELQKRRVVNKLKRHLGSLRGKTVALLGLAFKPNTDDLREAPSIVLASRLLAEGADVRAWDPVADASEILEGVTFTETPLEAVSGAHAAVIVTEWDELRELASPQVKAAMQEPIIIDGRNLLDPRATREAGFVYEGIGRAASPADALPETAEPALRPEAREPSSS